MSAICIGRMTKVQVVNETVEQYREVYTRMQQQSGLLRKVETQVSTYPLLPLMQTTGCPEVRQWD